MRQRHLKTASKRETLKTAEPTGDLTGNKIFGYGYKGHITKCLK